VNLHAVSEKRLKLARKGAVLFPKSGASILTNSRAKLGFNAYVVSHLAIVDALPQFLDDDFLYHWLCTLDMSQASQSEDGYPSLRLSDIAAFEIPLPPLAEQQRLVNRIESLTSRLEEARNARLSAADETANSFRSIIAAAFNSFNAAPTRRLGDIARIIGGNSIPEDGPRPASDIDRIGLMKVSDMNTVGNETMLRSCRLETTRVHAKEKRLRVVPAGAVVFPKRGGAIATNKKRTLAIPAALDPNMMGVFPMEGSGLSSEFLRWWFESIDLADLQEDGGIPQVNKKHLDPLEIPVPSFAEQNRLVERLDALAKKQTELRRLQAETEAELAAFTPALLAKAFRGEL
jgi:type I restriction enzyme S subunit